MRWLWLLVVLVVAGCGVRPTDPVAAGNPPLGAAAGPILFFVRDGKLEPVMRESGRLGTVSGAVVDLLSGPTQAEIAAGYTTELLNAAVSTSVSALREGFVTVSLSPAPVYLSETAVDQIVCTVIAVQAQLGASAGGIGVRIDGRGWPGGGIQPTGSAWRCPVIS
ncbi:hypothetical protein GCM10027445_05230 [Amycolatopsis endophytica]|uniref:GerMN domain-containing protein n=1 Tax=Amycolatopsis endophytica TaxID=860233 RepID=A0A853B8P7_9PSEU|nr:hypothetical protein [Amycolatopsis endophytica]NYI91142.1 hypothetical protein [Amycolatopsis endophytica]